MEIVYCVEDKYKPAEQYINVRDIEDLVRIADEISLSCINTVLRLRKLGFILSRKTLCTYSIKGIYRSLRKEKAMLIEKKKA